MLNKRRKLLLLLLLPGHLSSTSNKAKVISISKPGPGLLLIEKL